MNNDRLHALILEVYQFSIWSHGQTTRQLTQLQRTELRIMSQFTEFATDIKAFMQAISDGVDALGVDISERIPAAIAGLDGDIKSLNQKILDLTATPEDLTMLAELRATGAAMAARIQALKDAGESVTANMEALDALTPPVPPSV